MADHLAPSDEPRPPLHADGPTVTPADPSHRADAAPDVEPRARHRRRVQTDPPAGSDPTPESETPRHTSTENDEQLKRDKPPHWG